MAESAVGMARKAIGTPGDAIGVTANAIALQIWKHRPSAEEERNRRGADGDQQGMGGLDGSGERRRSSAGGM
ncbi:MAG TPA: hypothetical protein VIM62_06985, partial [Acidobacteriaceae bacterium]